MGAFKAVRQRITTSLGKKLPGKMEAKDWGSPGVSSKEGSPTEPPEHRGTCSMASQALTAKVRLTSVTWAPWPAPNGCGENDRGGVTGESPSSPAQGAWLTGSTHPCCANVFSSLTTSALWEVEAGGLQVWGKPGQLSHLVRPCLKMTKGLGM